MLGETSDVDEQADGQTDTEDALEEPGGSPSKAPATAAPESTAKQWVKNFRQGPSSDLYTFNYSKHWNRIW